MQYASQKVKQKILKAICRGSIRVGETLPSIPELSETFNISINTVHAAIRSLEEDGVVEVKRRKGTVVKRLPGPPHASRRLALLTMGEQRYMETHPFPRTLFTRLKQALKRKGYECIWIDLNERLSDIDFSVNDILRERKTAGTFLFEIESDFVLSELRELMQPVVSIDYDLFQHGIGSVVFDNIGGAFRATRHLIDQGHKQIAFLDQVAIYGVKRRMMTGSSTSFNSVRMLRYEGYRVAMEEAGLKPRQEIIRTQNCTEMLQKILASPEQPTAFLTGDSRQGTQLADSLIEMGFSVPGHISVMGFGDYGFTFGKGQKLASVRADPGAMARRAAAMMLGMMKGTEPERVMLPVTIEKRKSVGSVKA